jgi:hypothetical protein
MYKLLLTFFLIANLTTVAQVTFKKEYGNVTSLTYATETSDGGYVISGQYEDSNFTVSSYIFKVNFLGDTMWSRFYKQFNSNAIKKTVDNGFVMAGYWDEMILLKADSIGNIEWAKDCIGINGTKVYAKDVAPTSDGGYIVAADQFYVIPMYGDVCLIKTNSIGDTLWTRTFNNGSQSAVSVIETLDSSYLLVTQAFHLYKINRFGDTLWTKRITGFLPNANVTKVIQSRDGGFLFTGTDNSIFLLKTDSAGSPQWCKTFKALNNDVYSGNVRQTYDDGFMLSGVATQLDTTYHQYGYLIKTNPIGDTVWTNLFPSASELSYADQTSDSGFITGCLTPSGFSLIKADINGNNYCNDFKAPSIVGNHPFQIATPPILVLASYFSEVPKLIIDSSGITVSTTCFSTNTTGNNKDDEKATVFISPNPFHVTATLSIPEAEVQIGSLKTFNTIGALAREEEIHSINSFILQRGNLHEGLYFFELRSDAGFIAAGKFVIE